MYYQKEIAKGLSGLAGDFILKKEFLELKVEPKSAKFPKPHIPLKDLPYCFAEYQKKNEIQPKEEIYSRFALAQMLQAEGAVKLHSDVCTFTVSTPKNTYYVSRNPDTCTCGYGKNCHHISAVKLSIKDKVQQCKNVQLKEVYKTDRGGQRSGRKRPAAADVAIIHKSSTSEEESSDKIGDAVTIPVVNPNASTKLRAVHRRFAAIHKEAEKTLVIVNPVEPVVNRSVISFF